MTFLRLAAVLSTALLWADVAAAADFDGSKPFVCALLDLSSCEAGNGCEAETPESVDIPRFLFVDVQQAKISGTRQGGRLLTTKIERARTLGDFLVLEGAEGSLSWTVTVGQAEGQMSLGAVGDGVGFVVFGSCVRASPN